MNPWMWFAIFIGQVSSLSTLRRENYPTLWGFVLGMAVWSLFEFLKAKGALPG